MNRSLVARATSVFQAAFGQAPSTFVQAPGRVNLIGEHTDYNDGMVLPCAIDYRTLIAARARDDRLVRVVAADYDGAMDVVSLDALITRLDKPLQDGGAAPGPHENIAGAAPMWANYVRGVLKVLVQRGLPMRGMDMVVAGDIPQGAGLSSSASLSVAVCRLFATLPGFGALSPVAMALIAQASENDFVGCQCGNMDQISSACGIEDHALLIDCRSLDVQAVPIPQGAAIVIINSQVQRGLVDSEYNTRRLQCEKAAAHFGLSSLRDLDLATLESRGAELDPVVLRRARHVVTENARVLMAAEALAKGDLPRMGELMAASHASMCDDFEITVPLVDRLVDIIKTEIGTAGGVRMTGGGFGGCVVALVPQALADRVRAAVAQAYRGPKGEAATIYVCRAAVGAGLYRAAA